MTATSSLKNTTATISLSSTFAWRPVCTRWARAVPSGPTSGGLGYFWFLDSWDDRYYETIEDPDFPGTFLTFEDHQEDTETVADGFFPFVMAGVNVAVNDNLEVLAELQYDISKEASGFDFSGPIYMLGARFRF